MSQQFQLEKYKGPTSRHFCPQCHHKNQFTYYIDTYTGDPVSPSVGRCNREIECGYHYAPKDYFRSGGTFSFADIGPQVIDVEVEVSFLPEILMKKSLSSWDRNNFFKFLSYHLDDEYVEKIMHKYLVGTSRHWEGATLFWQKDIHGRVRQAKVMHYDAVTGKRTKSNQVAQKYERSGHYFDDINNGDKVAFIGKKILENKNAYLKQCFFGEHLLAQDSHKQIGVVESEKTAIIASIFIPNYIWIATGGVNGCKWRDRSVASVFKDREVVLFPDVGCFESWSKAAQELSSSISCHLYVSSMLEEYSKGMSECIGWDLADFILKSNTSLNTWTGVDGYPLIWDRNNDDYE
jgi:hypothetical protein